MKEKLLYLCLIQAISDADADLNKLIILIAIWSKYMLFSGFFWDNAFISVIIFYSIFVIVWILIFLFLQKAYIIELLHIWHR